jgi:F0F1-type ATP synthase assembly protein I
VPQQDNKNNNQLMQYTSLATQLAIGLLIAVWLGKKLDARLQFAKPVFIWIFPLVVIIAMMYKLIRDTINKK